MTIDHEYRGVQIVTSSDLDALIDRALEAEARNVALVARWERLKAWLSTAITMAQPEVYAITHKMASLERPIVDCKSRHAVESAIDAAKKPGTWERPTEDTQKGAGE